MCRSNMSRFAVGAIASLALAIGACGTAAAAEGVAQRVDSSFSGWWVINEDLSDDPRPQPGARDRDDGRRGPGGFGDPGWGPGGGFGGVDVDPQQLARMRADMQEALRDLMTAPRRMRVVADEDEIVLTYDDRRVVRFLPDGREHSGLAGTSARVTRRTRWRGGRLETEIELQSRMELRVRQTYEVRTSDVGGRQLIVTTRVDGGRRGRDRELRRVYDVELR